MRWVSMSCDGCGELDIGTWLPGSLTGAWVPEDSVTVACFAAKKHSVKTNLRLVRRGSVPGAACIGTRCRSEKRLPHVQEAWFVSTTLKPCNDAGINNDAAHARCNGLVRVSKVRYGRGG